MAMNNTASTHASAEGTDDQAAVGTAEVEPSDFDGEVVVEWTPAMLERFKIAEAQAKGDFTFAGNDFIKPYARYLIEHLDAVFTAHES